jgi:hypothetical protein
MALTSVRPAAACVVLTMTLIASWVTPDVRAQQPSPAEGPWSGQAQCVVISKFADYLDEQTHTWRLTGEAPTPAPRGSSQVYYSWPATWSVQGGGRKTWPAREPGGREQTERWTAAHEMKMSLRFTEIRVSADASADRLRVGTEGQRGAPLGSLRVTEVSGRTRDQAIQQWVFPTIEDSASNTTISGTSTRTYPEGFGVGPGQPPKAVTTATCTWNFTRGGVEQSSANRPTGGTQPGALVGAPRPRGISQPVTAGRGQGSLQTIPDLASQTGPTLRDPALPRSVPGTLSNEPIATEPARSQPRNAASSASNPQPDDPAAFLGTAGEAPRPTLLCPMLPQPPFSATPGQVTFQLNRPAGTTGYVISRRDLGDLTPAPITASSFTHTAPLDDRVTYEYMFHGVLADGGCTSATANVTPPRPLIPQVTATVTQGTTSRVTLSWPGQADRPTSYVIGGAGLPNTAEVAASTSAAGHSFTIDNLQPGTHSWEVSPIWKTPTGNMGAATGARVTATIAARMVGPLTFELVGFTGTGSWVVVPPRTVELTGFSATGTFVVVAPRTIELDGWTGSGTSTAIQGVIR